MELKINRKSILEALSGAGQVAAKTSTLPILENVKVNVRGDGTIVVTAFDLEVSAMRKFKFADSAHEFDFCVNPRDLIGVLKTLRDEDIVLAVDDNECVVKHAKGKVSFPVLPAIDFPVIENESNATKVSLDAETLFDWLKNGVKFVANDKLRPIICGVHMYVEGTEVGVAASDGQKLFADFMRADIADPVSVNGTLGTKAVSPLLDMINGADKVVVYFGEKMLSFRTDKAMLSCIKPVGAYPKFKMLIRPKDNPTKVTVDKTELLDSVSRAILSAKVDTCLLRLTIGGNTLTVDSEDILFNKKAKEEVACTIEGAGITIGVKGSSLVDCLSAVDGDSVVMELDEVRKPINIYDLNCPNKALMVCPLVLNN